MPTLTNFDAGSYNQFENLTAVLQKEIFNIHTWEEKNEFFSRPSKSSF